MNPNLTKHRKNIAVLGLLIAVAMTGLLGRLGFLMLVRADHYGEMARDLHERERTIKAARGRILDAGGNVIADNRTVCTISVIYNQVTDREEVIRSLCSILELSEEPVRKKVEKRSSREIIKTNVDKETGDKIRALKLDGVKVDEDYKRYYPMGSLASKVLGFTGGDNQGIIGLEVMYEKYLKGKNGVILTLTDARGVELDKAAEDRIEPVAGNDLQIVNQIIHTKLYGIVPFPMARLKFQLKSRKHKKKAETQLFSLFQTLFTFYPISSAFITSSTVSMRSERKALLPQNSRAASSSPSAALTKALVMQ